MQVRYFVSHHGKSVGPFSFREIEEKLTKSLLAPTDYVYVNDSADWVPILEFVVVYGPKERIVMPALKTAGAEGPMDSRVDFERFQILMPKHKDGVDGESAFLEIYPSAAQPVPGADAVVAPPAPPQTQAEPPKTVAPRSAPPQARPRPTPPPKSSAPKGKDKEAKAPLGPTPSAVHGKTTIRVLPRQAVRIELEASREARVGNTMTLRLKAVDDIGEVDTSYNAVADVTCDRPVEGLGRCQFHAGVATIEVRLIESGEHRFDVNSVAQAQGDRTDGNDVSDSNVASYGLRRTGSRAQW